MKRTVVYNNGYTFDIKCKKWVYKQESGDVWKFDKIKNVELHITQGIWILKSALGDKIFYVASKGDWAFYDGSALIRCKSTDGTTLNIVCGLHQHLYQHLYINTTDW